MTPVITAEKLSRWYGIVMGLNHVSFEIEPGLTGLVGPNGAGKTTLIQIITGQLQPSSGTMKVFGQEPWNNPDLLRHVGFCPESEAVHEEMKPMDWLTSLGLMSGIDPDQIEERAREILDLVRLDAAHWTKRLSQYSKGMRQRVKLAQALMHRPRLLVLDEPMNGLDPMGRQEMAHILRDLAAAGTSILVSSHILAELETLCQHILILNWGKVIATGDQRQIRAELKNWSEQLTIRCDRPEHLAKYLFNQHVLLGFDLDLDNMSLHIRVKDPTRFYQNWTEWLLDSGVTVFEIRSRTRSLQELFEKVTE